MCFTNISAEFYIMLCYSTDYENIVSVVMDDVSNHNTVSAWLLYWSSVPGMVLLDAPPRAPSLSVRRCAQEAPQVQNSVGTSNRVLSSTRRLAHQRWLHYHWTLHSGVPYEGWIAVCVAQAMAVYGVTQRLRLPVPFLLLVSDRPHGERYTHP